MPGPRASASRRPGGTGGLADLRRPGAVTELLFLFECLAREPTQLRPVARQLGLTVQAASHTFRALAARGLAESRDGRYRATVAGVAWLHDGLGGVADDLRARLERLHVVRSTRAVAAAPLSAGDAVSLDLLEGVLTARPGLAGPSRGRAVHRARTGELVEVRDLEGIVPLARGAVHVLTVAESALDDPRTLRRLRSVLREHPTGLLAAPGLEAFHLLRRAGPRPVLRYGVAAACSEASRVGVPSLVVVLERELARFLGPFEGGDPPPIEVTSLRAIRPGARA